MRFALAAPSVADSRPTTELWVLGSLRRSDFLVEAEIVAAKKRARFDNLQFRRYRDASHPHFQC